METVFSIHQIYDMFITKRGKLALLDEIMLYVNSQTLPNLGIYSDHKLTYFHSSVPVRWSTTYALLLN